jgi:hypothetical protein
MADDTIGEMERFITPEDKETGETSPEQTAADILGGGDMPAGDYTPGSLSDVLEHMPQDGWTPEDMASSNASNAEARAKAIADGMDEQTANIVYPEFNTPEDMNRIN